MSDREMAVDYAGGAPKGYACAQCKKHGVKLWRQYNTFACHIRLLCASCAAEDQGVTEDVGDDGRVMCRLLGERTDQIGNLVPAVPTEDGDTFWGYTSVPTYGVEWWRRLPTRIVLDEAGVERVARVLNGWSGYLQGMDKSRAEARHLVRAYLGVEEK